MNDISTLEFNDAGNSVECNRFTPINSVRAAIHRMLDVVGHAGRRFRT